MDDLVYVAASLVPLVGGVFVGKRAGKKAGIATGVGLFIAVVLILVAAGYGY